MVFPVLLGLFFFHATNDIWMALHITILLLIKADAINHA